MAGAPTAGAAATGSVMPGLGVAGASVGAMAGMVAGPSTPLPVAGGAGMAGGTAGSAGMMGSAGNAGAMASAGNSGAGMTGGTAGSAGMMGTAGSAGMGAAGTGMAGMAGSDSGEMTDCGAGGMVGKASNDGGAQGRGYANVRFTVSATNQITRLRTTLEVPVRPSGNTTLFIWPGLEPLQGGENYQPIGTGVLQPVLTWGGSCAPGSPQSLSGDHWWISSQYVNTLGSAAGFMGCKGGPVMNVDIGDKLVIDMVLNGAVWTQTVTSEKTGKAVDFDIDLKNQAQRWALFEIEMATSTRPASDIVFTDTLLTFKNPEPNACKPTRGTNDYHSAPVSSSDGLRCCVQRIVLREQGVTATTTDP